MKRTVSLLLAAVLLALAGCGTAQPASSPESGPAKPQGPGLVRHPLAAEASASLRGEDARVQVQLFPSGAETRQRVATSPQLLADMADALYYSAVTDEALAEGPIVDDETLPAQPDTAEAADSIFLAAPGAGLNLTLYLEGEACIALISLGTESACLTYPPGLYHTVLAWAQAAQVPDTVALEGEGLPLRTQNLREREMTTQWMESAGGLAGLYTWSEKTGTEQRSALEIFDRETGESLYYHEIGAEALRMEAASFAACDMRVLMEDGAVWYLNSQNPEVKPYFFYLPKELRDRLLAPCPQDRPVFRSYDGGPGQGAVWAVVDEEGLTWARRSQGATLSNDVILENIPAVLYKEGATLPQFGEVCLMNNGATLVATVMLPDSQIGAAGLFTYQISSGTMGWHFGMFKPMLADLRFLDDKNLVVAGDEEIFRLNVATGETETTPVPEGLLTAATPDYQHYLFVRTELNADGTWTTGLYPNGAGEAVLTATAGMGDFFVQGITPGYAVLLLDQLGEDGWLLTRWA